LTIMAMIHVIVKTFYVFSVDGHESTAR
jgi:hypothetical protein